MLVENTKMVYYLQMIMKFTTDVLRIVSKIKAPSSIIQWLSHMLLSTTVTINESGFDFKHVSFINL